MTQITMFHVSYIDRITDAFQPEYFSLSGIKTIKDACNYLDKRNGEDTQIMGLVYEIDQTYLALYEDDVPE